MTLRPLILVYAKDYIKINGGHQWCNIEDDLWWNLIQNLSELNINGVGFQNMVDIYKLPQKLSSNLTLTKFGTVEFSPYHDNDRHEIALFEWDSHIQSFFKTKLFSEWDGSNQELPYDELCFFNNQCLVLQAIPYENLLFFYNFSKHQIESLIKIDQRFKHDLYDSQSLKPIVI